MKLRKNGDWLNTVYLKFASWYNEKNQGGCHGANRCNFVIAPAPGVVD
jgi:hypothetical protein